MGTLYYSDNLDILKRYIKDETVGLDAAEKLGRDWIGIDVTQLAILLIKNRLEDTYGRRMKFISEGARPSRSHHPASRRMNLCETVALPQSSKTVRFPAETATLADLYHGGNDYSNTGPHIV